MYMYVVCSFSFTQIQVSFKRAYTLIHDIVQGYLYNMCQLSN